jgi:pyridoxamine 5'-phosphate oxidase
VLEPNAMTLATATRGGFPSARTVLLKGFDARGFVFFTNYESRKGREILENPNGALVFHWRELERQVCVRGEITKAPREETEAYFRSRPRASQLGAWASKQSSVVASREVLEAEYRAIEASYAELPVPVPPHWGGYVLAAREMELWQGRPGRMHDRLLYRLSGPRYVIERLSP